MCAAREPRKVAQTRPSSFLLLSWLLSHHDLMFTAGRGQATIRDNRQAIIRCTAHVVLRMLSPTVKPPSLYSPPCLVRHRPKMSPVGACRRRAVFHNASIGLPPRNAMLGSGPVPSSASSTRSSVIIPDIHPPVRIRIRSRRGAAASRVGALSDIGPLWLVFRRADLALHLTVPPSLQPPS